MKSFKQVLQETACESDDYGSEMTVRELQVALNAAQELIDMIEQGYPIERWNESKITLAADYLSSVSTYMKTLSPMVADDSFEEPYQEPEYVGHEYNHVIASPFPFVYEQVEVNNTK